MKVKQLWTEEEDRAVSPVVGVALLIAITVILAAVIGGVVLGLGSSSANAPQASLQFEYNATGSENLTISHAGGEVLNGDEIEVRVSGEAVISEELGDLRSGEKEHLPTSTPAAEGDEFSVVWMDPNSNDEVILGTFEYRP